MHIDVCLLIDTNPPPKGCSCFCVCEKVTLSVKWSLLYVNGSRLYVNRPLLCVVLLLYVNGSHFVREKSLCLWIGLLCMWIGLFCMWIGLFCVWSCFWGGLAFVCEWVSFCVRKVSLSMNWSLLYMKRSPLYVNRPHLSVLLFLGWSCLWVGFQMKSPEEEDMNCKTRFSSRALLQKNSCKNRALLKTNHVTID